MGAVHPVPGLPAGVVSGDLHDQPMNYQLRKVIKNGGHFHNDAAVIKLLWLAICKH